MELRVAELPDGDVVEVRDAATLDSLVGLQTVVFVALVVEVGLEIVVDDLAVGLGEARLLLVVAVAEVVTVAAREEVVASRLVWGLGAAVVGPDEAGRFLGGLRAQEAGHRGVQKEAVGLAGRTADGVAEGWGDGEEEDSEDLKSVHGGLSLEFLVCVEGIDSSVKLTLARFDESKAELRIVL